VAPVIKHSTLLNPVALLSQAFASIVGLESGYVVLGNGPRVPASVVARHAALALSSAQSNSADLEFVAGHEQATVTLLLAESQVRVRLAPDLLLRCEVSSRDDANTDAELKFDLGVQFKFK
jgi:hypothetical protein